MRFILGLILVLIVVMGGWAVANPTSKPSETPNLFGKNRWSVVFSDTDSLGPLAFRLDKWTGITWLWNINTRSWEKIAVLKDR